MMTREDMLQPDIQASMQEYHLGTEKAFGDDSFVDSESAFDQFINEDIPDPTDMSAFDKDVEEVDSMVNDKGEDSYDGYVNTELHLPQQDGSIQKGGREIKRVKGNDGKPLGTSHTNPLIDTSEYLIEMSDGSTDQYAANVIAENLFSQVDSEGRLVLSEITDHSADGRAIKQADGFTKSSNDNQVPKQTTIGWKLLVGWWKDGSEEWIPLKNLKASNPIELAEYAIANNLVDEPAFKWWVAETLRKRSGSVSSARSRAGTG